MSLRQGLMPRYRFDQFVVSPRRRLLLNGDREQPLIPRYFDLLVLLLERRHEAVHRRDIFDRVWADVVVSDSALTQAIRTIRRALGDDPREPRFIRTVSRHGYRFVFVDVIEEADEGATAAPAMALPPPREESAARSVAVASEPLEPAHVSLGESIVDPDPFAALLERIVRDPDDLQDEEDQRDAAERLHSLGTAEALSRLGKRPGHARARAILRDTRWNVPGAGDVPLLGEPSGAAAAMALVGLRLRSAARIVAERWAFASAGGGAAGIVGGAVGGLLVAAAPGSNAPLAIAPVLAVIGGMCGAIGGAGVGAGLSMAEATARSRRAVAVVAGAALGGGMAGLLVQLLGRWSLSALVGISIETGGGVEGILIGGAAGLGYALSTSRSNGGMAAPRGRNRARTIALTAVCCAVAALSIAVSGRPLVGGTINRIAGAADGSQATLAPLGRLLGEPGFGPLSSALIGTGEGAVFGLGLAAGLTHRRRT
jgi:DNA-binding winged helix-turn-helix (wHTH) protein